ncbi:hypothetical protein DUI87_02700 [Hirundo rustica rustica]|uniref:Peptidase A2 domain-containing protein n=1 Tax=Hirundo rustica rustica TaxID=333673 RepID=A0A3M0LFX7_HIRRU|nr:hypothetical protein DUI87_02700 [Hirundo rustica rustica]
MWRGQHQRLVRPRLRFLLLALRQLQVPRCLSSVRTGTRPKCGRSLTRAEIPALLAFRPQPGRYPLVRTEDRSRGDGGFGSTGPPQVRWTAVLTKDRPETLCTVSMVGATPSEIHLRGLLDTGADVSILSLAAWPPQWPLTLAKTLISGLGGMKLCYVSQNPMAITNPEGQTAIIWPHVTEIPQNLWGKDVFATWGVRLGTDF